MGQYRITYESIPRQDSTPRRAKAAHPGALISLPAVPFVPVPIVFVPFVLVTLVFVTVLVSAPVMAGQTAQPAPASAPTPAPTTAPVDPPSQPDASQNAPRKHKSQSDRKDLVPDSVIPVTPLGFAPPSRYYLGDRFSQVSLDFLDEDTLLFTFRVPGLISRDPVDPKSDSDPGSVSDLRTIRALVLTLPTGRVTAESLWRLHDHGSYLLALKNKRFLLRDRNQIQVGDSDLRLTPFLSFPGPVRHLELDPSERLLVANTLELPVPDSDPKPTLAATGCPSTEALPRNSLAPTGALTATTVDSKSTPNLTANLSQPNIASNCEPGYPGLSLRKPDQAPQNLVRILSMDDRGVMFFTHVPGIVHVAVDSEGYYQALEAGGNRWMIVYNRFNGATTQLSRIESDCSPTLDVQAPGIVLASACTSNGARRIIAIARDWHQENDRLWDAFTSATSVWPRLARAAGGLRVARATLEVTHPISSTSPLDTTDIRAQQVEVYDLATGRVPLRIRIAPILDAGGNFALSPSGNRFAALNEGQIQIYNLPPAPPLPAPPTLAAAPKQGQR